MYGVFKIIANQGSPEDPLILREECHWKLLEIYLHESDQSGSVYSCHRHWLNHWLANVQVPLEQPIGPVQPSPAHCSR